MSQGRRTPSNLASRVGGNLAVVLLYHGTDTHERCQAIRNNGFTESTLPDSKGCAWLASSLDRAQPGFPEHTARDWLVIVELPDHVAERHRVRFPTGDSSDLFKVPVDVLNRRQPFRYEQVG